MTLPADRTSARAALLVSACAIALLVGITTYRLEHAGLFYEEVHQAPGAFAYVGRPTNMFSMAPIGGLPLMNMPYSGALKTAIYGVYLRTSGRPFSIVSWRLLAIAFAAAGIAAFGALAGRLFPLPALALFYALLLTDLNLLLQTRHDWGPAALGFLIRMVFIGLGLRVATGRMSSAGPFVLGMAVGLAIFEKLTAFVLLGPLALILLAHPDTRTVRAAVLAAAGVVLGTLPVIVANLITMAASGQPLVASGFDLEPGRSMVGYLAIYLAIGNGGLERRWIFDAGGSRWTEWLEGAATVGLLVIAGSIALKRAASDSLARLAVVALASFAAIAIALRLLPHRTAEQHWIVGTPFQYLGVALAAAVLWSEFGAPARGLFTVCLVALLAARVPAAVSVYESIRDDRYALWWDPSVSVAANYAARQPEGTVFIAANFGTANQVLCLANGRQDFVFEPFWHYQGRLTLNSIIERPDRQLALVGALRPRIEIKPGDINTQWQVTEEIFDNIATSPGWKEVPVDPSVRGLRAVELRAFRRIDPVEGRGLVSR